MLALKKEINPNCVLGWFITSNKHNLLNGMIQNLYATRTNGINPIHITLDPTN